MESTDFLKAEKCSKTQSQNDAHYIFCFQRYCLYRVWYHKENQLTVVFRLEIMQRLLARINRVPGRSWNSQAGHFYTITLR